MAAEHQALDVYHLSNLPKNQLWFWIGQNLGPDEPFFNMPMALTIQGEIDSVRFSGAFQQVINRADALRTVIKLENGIPQRVVLDRLEYSVDALDFSQADNPKQVFDDWAGSRCRQIFDLEKRLFDSVLIRLSDHQTIWYWCQHHLICDGWSTALVYRYVSEFYQKSFDQDIDMLPGFPSFEAHVGVEKQYRASRAHEGSKNYWEKVLAEPLDSLNFYGRTARDHGLNKAVRITRDLGQVRTRAIKVLCKQKPFTSLSPHLAAFQLISTCLLAYLYRITGNENLALGSLYHNRATVDDKKTVGFFMETAPLRVSLSAEDSFESLYLKTKRSSMEVMRHYRYAPGNPIHNRAYDVAINYNNATYPPFADMPMSLHWLHTGAWYAHEPLAIQIHDYDKTGTLTVAFDFNVGVFDEATRERAIQHFFNCIDAIISNPKGLIKDFEILTAEEQTLFSGPFRAQTGFELSNDCLHELFEQQVMRTPNKVAVYNSTTCYTYENVFARVNQLAGYLILQGVGLDEPVGLSFNKHPDMIVAMLAILKSGGGYLPLDPDYPSDRLDYMIKDSGIKMILTQASLIDKLPDHNCQLIRLDSDWSMIAGTDLNDSQIVNSAKPGLRHLAYVIYTSGSTGRPKGVMIEHRSIVNYTLAAQQAFGFCEQDKVLQFSSISFDTAGEEIYPTLSSGGALYLADKAMLGSAKDFFCACEREKITFLDLPTAFWHQIAASILEDGLTLPASIRSLIIGGERAQPQAVANWIAHDNNVKLINTYGPTECAIVSSYCELNAENTRRDQEVPIGIPVKNLYAYVLDKNLKQVAIGVTGELHMGGVGLARGYLGKPEITVEKFVADPFSKDKNDRLYKTGDLVRFRGDGVLEYRDRVDDQVKIRGYRIEIGEVESAFIKVQEIEQGIVSIHRDENNNKSLVAYYVPCSGKKLTTTRLRSALKKTLPDYMLPKHFVALQGLPLTANGKINRAALPEPSVNDGGDEADGIAPESLAQQKIASVWLTLPNINKVGLYDNFFDIGGDSLLMMQVIASMERELKFKATPRMLVSLNLAQLAGELEAQHPDLKIEPFSNAVDETKITVSENFNTHVSTPFFFQSGGRKLFAYYHAPFRHSLSKVRSGQNPAVLLCYPMGQEYMRVFRCFKLLANRLVDSGCDVLRFDYFGSGDSEGAEKECSINSWLKNLSDAIGQLKQQANVEQVSILGLRLGANLAIAVSRDRPDIKRVISWDPIQNGRQSLHNLRIMNQQMLSDPDRFCRKRSSSDCTAHELIGFDYSPQLLSQIETILPDQINKDQGFDHQIVYSNSRQKNGYCNSQAGIVNCQTFNSSISWSDMSQIETSIAPQNIMNHIILELLK